MYIRPDIHGRHQTGVEGLLEAIVSQALNDLAYLRKRGVVTDDGRINKGAAMARGRTKANGSQMCGSKPYQKVCEVQALLDFFTGGSCEEVAAAMGGNLDTDAICDQLGLVRN